MRPDPQFDDPYLQKDIGECEACEGTGDQACDKRGCSESAVGFNDDGEALCEDCMIEWAAGNDND